MNLPTVAFIGTGIMGQPMARNLLHAGFPVRAWNRSAAKAQELSAHGADIASSPAQAASGAQVLICMLSDGPTCDAVLFGEDGAALALTPGSLVIVMSSIPVDTAVEQARLCAEQGLRYLDDQRQSFMDLLGPQVAQVQVDRAAHRCGDGVALLFFVPEGL